MHKKLRRKIWREQTPFYKPRLRFKSNIKATLKEREGEYSQWIHLMQERGQVQTLVRTVITFRFPKCASISSLVEQLFILKASRGKGLLNILMNLRLLKRQPVEELSCSQEGHSSMELNFDLFWCECMNSRAKHFEGLLEICTSWQSRQTSYFCPYFDHSLSSAYEGKLPWP
jgi:hypothetical protein